MKFDCNLIAKKYNIPFIWNTKFPINSLYLMRGYLAVNEELKKKYFEKIQKVEIKDELKKLTNIAFEKNIFGAPTFVVNNKIFWGQDRLEYALDEYNS